MPSIVGINGVEKRIEEAWTDAEISEFKAACEKMRAFVKGLA